MQEEDEIIINDQSENGQNEVKQKNNQSNNMGNCFMAHLSLWIAMIALAVDFFAMLLIICGAGIAPSIFRWIAMGLVFTAVIIECVKYMKTRQFNIKGDLFFVLAIPVIIWLRG